MLVDILSPVLSLASHAPTLPPRTTHTYSGQSPSSFGYIGLTPVCHKVSTWRSYLIMLDLEMRIYCNDVQTTTLLPVAPREPIIARMTVRPRSLAPNANFVPCFRFTQPPRFERVRGACFWLDAGTALLSRDCLKART